MSQNPLDMLEARLETFVEGAFARLYQRGISARDIAILLLRAMEDNAANPPTPGALPIAPDIYTICLHPEHAAGLLARYPDMPAHMAGLIEDISRETGYQMSAKPQVAVIGNPGLAAHRIRINAEHSAARRMSTEKMDAVVSRDKAPKARLLVNDLDTVPLGKSVVNIGREASNDIVIADAYISRYHLQLRERCGKFTMFDINSRGGTRVNNATVREHQLQHGDVINIGRTKLVYAEGQGRDIDESTQVLLPD